MLKRIILDIPSFLRRSPEERRKGWEILEGTEMGSTTVGTKEQQLRALREAHAKGVIHSSSAVGAQNQKHRRRELDQKIRDVEQGKKNDDEPTTETAAAEPETQKTPMAEPTAEQESDMATKKSAAKKKAQKAKKTPKAKAPKKTKAPKAAKAAKTPKADGPRAGSKTEAIHALLTRKEGCTTADVLKETGWPSVSMPQQAKNCGLTISKEKVDKVTRYWGTAAA